MNKKVKIGIIITAAMVVAVSALVIAAHVYYGNRWYANTWIGEHELSGMSYDESEQMLQKVYDNYKLEIKGRNDGKHCRNNTMRSMNRSLFFLYRKRRHWNFT